MVGRGRNTRNDAGKEVDWVVTSSVVGEYEYEP